MDVSAVADLRKQAKLLGERIDLLLVAAAHERAVDLYWPDVDLACRRLKAGVGRNQDVQFRQVTGVHGQGTALIVRIDGISDDLLVEQGIVRPLMATTDEPARWDQGTLTVVSVERQIAWPQLLASLAGGSTLILAPGLPFVWVADTGKFPERAIGRPHTEVAIRGSQEAFTESLATQKAQLRRYLRSPQLRFRDLSVGRDQHQALAVAYLDNVCNPNLADMAATRLEAIDVAGISTATQLGELIRDHPTSMFPTIRGSERVDLVTWHLLQGGVAILTNGDPFVLLAPAPLIEFYRTSMDYSTSWTDASFTRLIRFLAWLMAMYLPALYVALAQTNPNLLPSDLFTVMQGNHAAMPFAPTTEIVLMIVVIEVLREAAIRLPTVLSTTIGTVGAIVVGTAVVHAGLVDPQVIVLMTLTALSLFATPTYELIGAWRLVGFALLVAAAVLGLVGIILTTMGILTVVMDMESFGVPYFTPWAPFRGIDWQDSLVRLPWTLITRRRTQNRPTETDWRHPAAPKSPPRLRQSKR